jgi:proline dehydrogenase
MFIASSLKFVPKPIVFRVARRYVAGVTLDDAMRTDRGLEKQGMRSTTALLGEHLHDRTEVEATVAQCTRLLEALEREGLEGGISVKPTHVGLLIDRELCRCSLDRLAGVAGRRGRFLRIDMEDHTTTDLALAIHRDLRQRHDNVGIVLQAYLKRTLDDIDALPDGSSVRLCKGIYVEPEHLVIGDYEAVRANYLKCLARLLERGAWPALATHDEWLIDASIAALERNHRRPDDWELQMLLGVAPKLRQRLLAQGRRIRVYVPYGPDWYDYSLRRLRENPRIAMHVVRALFGRS